MTTRALENAATGILIAVTVALAVWVIAHRSRSAPDQLRPIVLDAQTVHALHQEGHLIGSRDARVIFVEFADFRCPTCAEAAAELRKLLEEYPGQFAVRYWHFPLWERFPHSLAAATASECAAEQGDFEAFHDLLFQDLQTTPHFREIAAASDVGDLDAFERCLHEPLVSARLKRMRETAIAYGVRGTPTFLVKGRLIPGLAGVQEIRHVLEHPP